MKVVFFSYYILIFLFGIVSFYHAYNKTIHWEIDIAKKAKIEDQFVCLFFISSPYKNTYCKMEFSKERRQLDQSEN